MSRRNIFFYAPALVCGKMCAGIIFWWEWQKKFGVLAKYLAFVDFCFVAFLQSHKHQQSDLNIDQGSSWLNDVSYIFSDVQIWTLFFLPYHTRSHISHRLKKFGPKGRAGSIISHDITLVQKMLSVNWVRGYDVGDLQWPFTESFLMFCEMFLIE
jgi:hypothetical protein